MRTRPLIPVLLALGASLLSCQSGPATSPDTASTPLEGAATTPRDIPTATVVEANGSASEAVGVYWLTRDPSNPLDVSFSQSRTVAAQSDLYDLSIRSFMGPDNLEILSTVAGPNNTTDYTVQFTHPIAMPSELARPASADKRVSLFAFDVHLVAAVPGEDVFFQGAIRTNLDALPSADGYRMLGPLVDLEALGVANGTNVFPYQLVTNADHSGNPAGNYDAASGWIMDEFLSPTGYDVIPQGGSGTLTARVSNALTGPIPVIVVVKYFDPRAGATSAEKRANRLPDPGDPSLCRYFLPEAAGDLQQITTQVAGQLLEGSAVGNATITAHVLDWDHASIKAANFPNQSAVTQISEVSQPTQVEASFPDLQANGTFSGTLGNTTGLLNEFIDLTIGVSNVDQTYDVLSQAGDDLRGLIRIRDTQDTTSPAPTLLGEDLQPVTAPVGFELSTRFQFATVHMAPSLLAPELTQVIPITIGPNLQQIFGATNIGGAATTWTWNFGGGTTPNVSIQAAPNVLTGTEGTYNASVTASNAAGSDTLDFTLTIALPVPTLPPVPFNYGNVALPLHFTQALPPFAPVIASDNQRPQNPVTDAGATLGRVLFYDPRLSANNSISCASCHRQQTGFSDPRPLSIGFAGGETGRHSMGLSNTRFYDNQRMFWDERAATLEEQVLGPIQDSVEMGTSLPQLETELAGTAFYPPLFTAAFGDGAVTSERISFALAQFVRSIMSFRSKLDTAYTANPGGPPDFSVLTPQEQQGLQLFGPSGLPGRTVGCDRCHGTVIQSMGIAATPPGGPPAGPFATNNGLDIDTTADQGAGNGRFKAPSLRNIGITQPFMHDGRFLTLMDVVNFYDAGVQPHPNLDNRMRVGGLPNGAPVRLNMTQQEKDALVAFLRTLTDPTIATDVRFSNPFAPPPP